MVENQRDNIVNHPVDQQMALNKEQASLYERMLAIEKEKNALFTTTVFVVVKTVVVETFKIRPICVIREPGSLFMI